MATATQEARAATKVGRGADDVPESAWMEFVIVEDNGGAYRWMILGGSGQSLAQSRSFASHEDAEDAASLVREGARTARLERRAAADRPVETRRK